ncbi:MAG: hypothetical protein LBL58_15400 [Tannerellaceae bacterium]|nr:hypothetical protein [Tannerellaceae bacterium]
MKINLQGIESWDYTRLMELECWFCVKINNRIFFEEPLFPLLEFIYFYIEWGKDEKKNFVYNTIESEENPMIIFAKRKRKWRINSVWRRFECAEMFELEQLTGAVDKMIETLRG